MDDSLTGRTTAVDDAVVQSPDGSRHIAVHARLPHLAEPALQEPDIRPALHIIPYLPEKRPVGAYPLPGLIVLHHPIVQLALSSSVALYLPAQRLQFPDQADSVVDSLDGIIAAARQRDVPPDISQRLQDLTHIKVYDIQQRRPLPVGNPADAAHQSAHTSHDAPHRTIRLILALTRLQQI